MKNTSNEEIIIAICRTLNFHRMTFNDDMISKRYIYPVYPKSGFVTEVLNYLGMPADKARQVSDENIINFHDREIWSNKELFDFVEKELVSRL